MDIVRVLRVVEYVGPRDKMKEQIEKSIHGTKVFGSMRITAVTVGEWQRCLTEMRKESK